MKRFTLHTAFSALLILAPRLLGINTAHAQNWTLQSSGTAVNLNAVKAVSANVIWACGNQGTVLRTIDGGTNWTKVTSPISTLNCYSIEAIDANTAWVVAADSNGGNSALYKTTNGGLTWTRQLASTVSGSFYDAVRFYDANNGIMLGDPENGYFVIFTTTNGGTTWTRTAQLSIPAPLSGEFGLTNNLAIFGNNAWFGTGGVSSNLTRIFRSTDGGKTWSVSSVISGLGNFLVSTSFGTDAVGLELGSNRSVVQTQDGGITWSSAISTGATSGGGLTFVTPTVALTVGGGGSTFVSTDAGKSWSPRTAPVSSFLTGVSFASSSAGWAVGFGGTILKWTGGNLGALPLVTTNAATNVSSTSAILNGTVNPNGSSTTAYFEWGTSSTLATSSTTTSQSIGSGIRDSIVTANLTGLSASTTYYYRVVGQNSAGTSRGSIVSFTTSALGTAPTVTTLSASSVSSTSATLNGTVNPNGSATTAYFEWGTGSTLSSATVTAQQYLGSGTNDVPLTANLTGLIASTTYYYRVLGQNSGGATRGSIVSFTTGASGIPTATTIMVIASSITPSSATLNGRVNPNGLSTTAWFEWGGSSTLSPYDSTAKQSIGSSFRDSTVMASLTGLSVSTTYYYRVVGQNSAGISRGSILSFTTSGVLPTVTTSTATSITSTSATLNGSVNPNGQSTTVTFQYGTTTSYGSTVTATPSPVTGTSAVSVSAAITGLSPNTMYNFRVVATSSAGTTNGTNQTFTTLVSAAAPTLLSPANGATSQATTLTLSWGSSTGANIYRLQVSTSSTFATLVFDDFTITTTSKQVGPLAYNTTYYWRVSANGSSAFSSSFSFTTSSSTTVSPSTPITFPTHPTSSTDYRLFSVPGIATSVTVGQILSGTQTTDWRIFRDNGAASNYLVELSASSSLNTGEGYWLLRKGSLSPSLNLTLPPLGSDGTYSITLHSGWSIIGNPFDRSVSWSAVLAANGLSASTTLYEYTGTTTYAQSTTLDLFKGYYFDNRTFNLTSLKIPYPFSLSKVQPVSGPPIDWRLQLIFESDINSDRENYIGIAQSAQWDRDELDQRKPPLFLDQGFLYFPRPEWDAEYNRFSSDFRPSLGNGQVWEFEVSNPRLSQGKITFRGIEQIPAEYDVILISQYNSKPIDLRTTSEYIYQTVSEKMPFKLIVGKKAYIQNEVAKLLPEAFELAQNFPNPFNPSTAISFKLPRESEVRLEIVSLLGQRIVTLAEGKFVPGVHTVVWDGKDQLGKPVASGVYFYRLFAGTEVIQTKKMILAK